jgi:hypothetical protein
MRLVLHVDVSGGSPCALEDYVELSHWTTKGFENVECQLVQVLSHGLHAMHPQIHCVTNGMQ